MMLEKIKVLLGIAADDYTKDILLQFVIDGVTEIVLNYCNLELIPSGLQNTVVRMSIELYRKENLGSPDAPLGQVSSISEGDVNVAYKSVEYKESLLSQYKALLNRYRKVVF